MILRNEYSLAEASKIVKEITKHKFDASVDRCNKIRS